MTPFSASETVTGVGRTWTDFALTSSHRDTVTDPLAWESGCR